MFQLIRPQPLPIGLDVGSESIKLIQLALTPAGPAVLGAVRARVPDDAKADPDRRVAFAGDTLRAALRHGGFRGRRVVAALPKDVVHYKTHRLPPMPPADLTMAARIDARDLFRFDPDSADVQCLDAGEVRQGEDRRREVILVAAGKQYVNDLVRTLHAAGARVASLEIEPCAVRRAVGRLGPADGPEPLMLLDVGASQSRLLICKGEHVRVVKVIDVGADHLRSAVSRKLGLSAAEAEQLRRRTAAGAAAGKPADGVRQVLHDATRHAVETLARGVLVCLRYHAVTVRGPAPRRLGLVGGGAEDAQVRSILATTLSIPAEPLDLFPGIDTAAIAAADRTSALGEWAVALGLALKGVPPSATPPAVRPSADVSPASSAPVADEAHAAAAAAAITGASHE
jgi:type IV pilus assembly protein PilM